MIDYSEFFAYLKTTPLAEIADDFSARTNAAMQALSHGDFEKWCAAIKSMPEVEQSHIDLNADAVTIAGELKDAKLTSLKENLMQLHPWRKGPFDLFGIHIDTEWRSDLKWARLKDHLDLKDKLVLDVGCGNGYYLFRMLGAGAKAAIGVDPFLLYVMQFHAINKYVHTNKAAVLPLGVDDVPDGCGCFDTVFSMGILYHRREPKEHLRQLHGFLKPGGQVVLETIVLDTEKEELLVPEGRYGKMRNVWAIASPALLTKWLTECGFGNVKILDVTKTTLDEQRQTEWMTFESLHDFLDPNDDSKTIEGHPAPVRAILIAQKS
ncbi:MAG: tRNA 5-methoxyuridine(34)/uridine 5-oxyacetic acid(34) synthase CmoB [Phycisphaerae bacterium]|nr:tRNA 5-methoxyuridine(34)/uridine 5-oxyacetic acid(34) synthase CmoB [Phycisphaerae bacterium]